MSLSVLPSWLSRLGLLLLLTLLGTASSAAEDARAEHLAAFSRMKHGLFVHQVYRLTGWPDGRKTSTLDEFADAFDVPAFAEQVSQLGVEYVFFTAWHLAMYNLGPNKALERWLPGHTAKRDLIGEIADALHAKGIKLVLYAHPNDGHDLTKEEQVRVGYVDFKPEDPEKNVVLNRFINEVFDEAAERYGKKPNVLGFWWDSWYHNGARLDMPRLRQTVLAKFPSAIFLSNYYNGKLNPNFIDLLSLERAYTNGTKLGNIEELVPEPHNVSFPLHKDWWSNENSGKLALAPESMYRFLLMTIGCGAPGGVAWAVSPLADGKTWPSGGQSIEILRMLNLHLTPVRKTVCEVLPSKNWTLFRQTRWSAVPPFVATRSPAGDLEYVHVLKPPVGRSLDLPKPVEAFTSARMHLSQRPVALALQPDGGVRLTLPEGEAWSGLDTIIELVVTRRSAAP